jgi:hypothetical protein
MLALEHRRHHSGLGRRLHPTWPPPLRCPPPTARCPLTFRRPNRHPAWSRRRPMPHGSIAPSTSRASRRAPRPNMPHLPRSRLQPASASPCAAQLKDNALRAPSIRAPSVTFASQSSREQAPHEANETRGHGRRNAAHLSPFLAIPDGWRVRGRLGGSESARALSASTRRPRAGGGDHGPVFCEIPSKTSLVDG